jgi:hypothetical protein
MKLGSGIAPIAAMLARGVKVALGTDNNNGNDSNSMFDAMRLASLSGSLAGRSMVPTIDAACCLRMATQGGAAAMSGAGTVGSIAAGQLADFCILDANTSAFTPMNDAVTQLVFCEQGRSVSEVYVGGRKLIDQGRITSIDEGELLREAATRMPTMLAKVRGGAAHAERLRPYLETAFRRCLEEPEVAALMGAYNMIDAERRATRLDDSGVPPAATKTRPQ